MGAAMGAVMLATAMVTFAVIREPPHDVSLHRRGFFRSYKEALQSRVFLLSTIPWVLHILGVSIIQGALLFFFKYVFGVESMFQLALLALLTSSLVFIPLWVRIARRKGKRFAYNTGMTWLSVAVLVFFFAAPAGGPWFAVGLMAVAGFGFSTHYVMPHSILPDAVECDYAESGVRREGVFYSLFTFGSKVGQAVALGLNGWILSIVGYVAEQPQSELSILGIRLLCGPVPVLFWVAGIIVLSFYPVTKEYYDTILAKIKVREEGSV
jgi:GPH family glycoside/pentoside/hexuronide:cation symporter